MSKYEDMKETSGKLKLALVAVLVGAVLVGVAVATYTMVSNTVQVNVGQATLQLSVDSETGIVGDTFTLTATCSDTAFSGTVTFTANGTQIGTSAATGGVASYLWTPMVNGVYNLDATAEHA